MLSPVPDIGEVTRQPSSHQEDGIDANVIALAHEPRGKAFGRDRDAAQSISIQGKSGPLGGGARLDLHESQDSAAAGDQIDFAAWHASARGEDSPAMQAEPPGGEALGPAPALLGIRAPVQRLSSSARA